MAAAEDGCEAGRGDWGALQSEGWAPRQASAECPEDSDPDGPCCLLEGGSPAVEGDVVPGFRGACLPGVVTKRVV